ncbi:hypothetical protein CANCADRAFT_107837 [Tortispora caseinolytica NRRL Y-17796]|uniref:1-(5-phosphoribosyl)-5-[(5-phosphoribosylamino)methylideneamino] imidazole-4-carboxamide isomerase n=1 Tax=Tortispora caseinolytica NRRL Y-17796 TaxID=767744 RepID=A0A1E4TFL9_9ASCO|nr:hypothetical protein CANCADRAFT_107837 [Tortispora caseinolytica NRRL Y-17796]
MTLFKGCIDIHDGQVKQIVGASLDTDEGIQTNFVSSKSSKYYAQLYRENDIEGCHIIKLGPGCDEAALEAIREWKNGLQVGGGITSDNAKYWIDEGAAKVIVTSYIFSGPELDESKLKSLYEAVGKDKLVLDLSCKRAVNGGWFVATNRWRTVTNTELSKDLFERLAHYCSEFLIHAADVEGLCKGIDEDLVAKLGEWCDIPVTYAGGAKHIDDLALVKRLSRGKVDLTFGSALDIFGGSLVTFADCVAWNNNEKRSIK